MRELGLGTGAHCAARCEFWVTLCKPQLWVTVTKNAAPTLPWDSSEFVSQVRGWSVFPPLVLQVDVEKWDNSYCAHMKNRYFSFTEFLQSSGCLGDRWHQKCSSQCLQEWPLFKLMEAVRIVTSLPLKVKMEITAFGTLTMMSFSQ